MGMNKWMDINRNHPWDFCGLCDNQPGWGHINKYNWRRAGDLHADEPVAMNGWYSEGPCESCLGTGIAPVPLSELGITWENWGWHH